MHRQLSNNLHAALDTGNKEAALEAVSEAHEAYFDDLLDAAEYADIREDFTEAYPDLI